MSRPNSALAVAAPLLALLLSACGGGGGGSVGGMPPAPTPPPTRHALHVSLSGSGKVTSNPAGIDCGSTCSASFDAGTAVTLTATPASGQTFTGWSGDCSGAAATCTVAMSQARSVGAAFAAAPQAPAWVPTRQDRFLYQIGQPAPDTTACAVPQAGGACVRPTVWALDLYAADGRTPNADGVRAVHAIGGRAVCYVSGGTYEDWRPDAARFPPSVLGKPLANWPGERWLDIRQIAVLEPIMRARAQACAQAGFDAIDWDNVDGYANDTGFPLSGDDQLAYNRRLARIAHGLGLAVGLKNDLAQIPQLVADFDFAINEQCAYYRECGLLDPFLTAGKAVVQIEYALTPAQFCAAADNAGRSAMRMATALKATPWTPCR